LESVSVLVEVGPYLKKYNKPPFFVSILRLKLIADEKSVDLLELFSCPLIGATAMTLFQTFDFFHPQKGKDSRRCVR